MNSTGAMERFTVVSTDNEALAIDTDARISIEKKLLAWNGRTATNVRVGAPCKRACGAWSNIVEIDWSPKTLIHTFDSAIRMVKRRLSAR